MRTTLIVWLLVMITAGVTKSQTIYYGYDASGNRTSRSITLQKSTQQNNQNEQQKFADRLGEQDILIYPNPVKSEVLIEIPSLKADEFAALTIYDQGSRLIYQNEKAQCHTSVNLSDKVAGIYFLIIRIGQETTQWKIIKE
ncbi:MAG: T9SS type A sorting domain-containing protein [Bacteroidales bacterium]